MFPQYRFQFQPIDQRLTGRRQVRDQLIVPDGNHHRTDRRMITQDRLDLPQLDA